MIDCSIKNLKNSDINYFKELIFLFEDVFEMQNFMIPENEHLQNLLKNENFIVYIALLKNQVVGGLTAYVLQQYYSVKPLAYVYDLAVDRKYQRQGIGKRLIEAVNNYCRKKGFEEVFVQADKVDGYALDFYRSTNPTAEEDVSHFYYILNQND